MKWGEGSKGNKERETIGFVFSAATRRAASLLFVFLSQSKKTGAQLG
jgi:hypothetical protein